MFARTGLACLLIAMASAASGCCRWARYPYGTGWPPGYGACVDESQLRALPPALISRRDARELRRWYRQFGPQQRFREINRIRYSGGLPGYEIPGEFGGCGTCGCCSCSSCGADVLTSGSCGTSEWGPYGGEIVMDGEWLPGSADGLLSSGESFSASASPCPVCGELSQWPDATMQPVPTEPSAVPQSPPAEPHPAPAAQAEPTAIQQMLFAPTAR